MKSRIITPILAVTVLAGCSVAGPAAPQDVARAVSERTGIAAEDQGELADGAVRERVARLLAAGLTADGAARIALVNNAELRAAYARLGIARADLIEAGLLPNPVFDAEVHFRGGGIGSGTNLSLTEELVAIFQIPLRTKAATAALAAAKHELVGKALDVVAEARTAFVEAQAAEQGVELRRTVLEAARAAADIAARQRRAGNLSPLDTATERLAYARARRELSRAEAAAFDARERVNRALGLWGEDTRWAMVSRLPELPEEDGFAARDLEALAVRRRPELEQARAELEAAAAALGIADAFRYLPELTLGVDLEGENEGKQVVPGPNLSVPLPIFNQGQARVLQASSQFRAAEHRLRGVAVQVRSEVRSAYAKLRLARSEAAYDRETMIPAARELVRAAQAEYNGMLIGAFDLLRAKQEEVEAGGAYVEALRDFWLAWVALERATGGRLREEPAAAPEPTPAAPPDGPRPTTKHQHGG